MSVNVVIIGANRGIGLELCKQYLVKGYKVAGVCRKASTELVALGCKVVEDIDVSSDESVKSLSQSIGFSKIHILIHNSGILQGDTYPNIDMEQMKRHFDINSLGPLRSIMALESLLSKGSKVGIVSSRVGSIDDNSSSNNYAYRVSKTAANMIGKCLSIDLSAKGVALALLHPGYVRTAMTKHNGLIDANEAAAGLIERMEELTLEKTGIFVHSSGEVLTW